MRDYNFGNFIYTLRSEKGLSQSELGGLLGVTNKAVSKWENGTAKPNTSLFPKIGEILGVSVEELFAAKRIEKDDDARKLRIFLQKLRIKYAKLTSIFFTLALIFPLLIAEYVIASQIFSLTNDDLLALGSVLLLLGLIISIVCSLIYRGSFRHIPGDNEYDEKFLMVIYKGFVISGASLLCMIVLFPITCSIIADICQNLLAFQITTLSLALVLILSLGVWCFFAKLKSLLKIKFDSHSSQKTSKFSEQPLYIKIALFTTIILLPLKINLDFFNRDHSATKLIVSILFWSLLILISFHNLKNSRK